MYTAYCYYSDILSGLSDLPKEMAIQANTARRYGFLNGLLHRDLMTKEIYESQKHKIPRQVALAYSRFHGDPPEKLYHLLYSCKEYSSLSSRKMTETVMVANFLIGYLDAL